MNLAMLSANDGGKSRGIHMPKQKRRLPEGKRRFCYDHDM
jgi:hypothetical protein